MSATNTIDLWIEANVDQRADLLTEARKAASAEWGMITGAVDEADFANRLALAEPNLREIVASLTTEGSEDYEWLADNLVESFRQDGAALKVQAADGGSVEILVPLDVSTRSPNFDPARHYDDDPGAWVASTLDPGTYPITRTDSSSVYVEYTGVEYAVPSVALMFGEKARLAKKARRKTAELEPEDIPDDYEVRPLQPGENPPGKTTCGTCGLSWDDDIVTGITPAPSARCPFESFHEDDDDDDEVLGSRKKADGVSAPLACMECGNKFKRKITPTSSPKCPKCGSYDVDADYDHPGSGVFFNSSRKTAEATWDTNEVGLWMSNEYDLYQVTEGIDDPTAMAETVQDFVDANDVAREYVKVDWDAVDWDAIVQLRKATGSRKTAGPNISDDTSMHEVMEGDSPIARSQRSYDQGYADGSMGRPAEWSDSIQVMDEASYRQGWENGKNEWTTGSRRTAGIPEGEEYEPEEGDWATDGSSVWSLTEGAGGTWVPDTSVTSGLGDNYVAEIGAIQREQGYYPNVWWIDDHGGMELVTGSRRQAAWEPVEKPLSWILWVGDFLYAQVFDDGSWTVGRPEMAYGDEDRGDDYIKGDADTIPAAMEAAENALAEKSWVTSRRKTGAQCAACGGIGKVPGAENRAVDCAACGGTGQVPGATASRKTGKLWWYINRNMWAGSVGIPDGPFTDEEKADIGEDEWKWEWRELTEEEMKEWGKYRPSGRRSPEAKQETGYLDAMNMLREVISPEHHAKLVALDPEILLVFAAQHVAVREAGLLKRPGWFRRRFAADDAYRLWREAVEGYFVNRSLLNIDTLRIDIRGLYDSGLTAPDAAIILLDRAGEVPLITDHHAFDYLPDQSGHDLIVNANRRTAQWVRNPYTGESWDAVVHGYRLLVERDLASDLLSWKVFGDDGYDIRDSGTVEVAGPGYDSDWDDALAIAKSLAEGIAGNLPAREASYAAPEGEITAITSGEQMGTWNVFWGSDLESKLHEGPWTPEMLAWKERGLNSGNRGAARRTALDGMNLGDTPEAQEARAVVQEFGLDSPEHHNFTFIRHEVGSAAAQEYLEIRRDKGIAAANASAEAKWDLPFYYPLQETSHGYMARRRRAFNDADIEMSQYEQAGNLAAAGVCVACETPLNPLLPKWDAEYAGRSITQEQDAAYYGPPAEGMPYHQRCLDEMMKEGRRRTASIDLDEFVSQYMETAVWSSTDLDDEGTPLDANYSVEDIASETKAKMRADCQAFVSANAADLEGIDSGQAGHDFWLTRNHHGAGFWDRGLGAVGDRLTSAANAFGESDLYPGDDRKLYVSKRMARRDVVGHRRTEANLKIGESNPFTEDNPFGTEQDPLGTPEDMMTSVNSDAPEVPDDTADVSKGSL